MTAGIVCTPLRSERAALWGAVSAPVVRTGRGPAHRLDGPADAIAVAGVAGALDGSLRPGELVVAQELRRAGAVFPSGAAPLLHAALRRLGLPVRLGPIYSAERVVSGPARHALSATGAIAVDTESAFLAETCPGGRAIAIRAIVDTPTAPLLRTGTIRRGVLALRALRAAAPALDQWSAALGEREVLVTRYTGSADPPEAVAERALRDCGTDRRPAARWPDLVLVLAARPAGAQRTMKHPVDGCAPVHVADAVAAVDLRWLAGAHRIALVVTPTAPITVADDLIRTLSGLGPVRVHRATTAADLDSTPGR
jgi:4-hydroxy-3-methylbut-2-enyl diphosphate reductase